jgi:hypothetical protein
MIIAETVQKAPGDAADEMMEVLAGEEIIATIRGIIEGDGNVSETTRCLSCSCQKRW